MVDQPKISWTLRQLQGKVRSVPIFYPADPGSRKTTWTGAQKTELLVTFYQELVTPWAAPRLSLAQLSCLPAHLARFWWGCMWTPPSQLALRIPLHDVLGSIDMGSVGSPPAIQYSLQMCEPTICNVQSMNELKNKKKTHACLRSTGVKGRAIKTVRDLGSCGCNKEGNFSQKERQCVWKHYGE